MYGMVVSGVEPGRTKSEDKKEMMALIESYIKQDIIPHNVPKQLSDLKLYLFEEQENGKPERLHSPDSWMDEYSHSRPKRVRTT